MLSMTNDVVARDLPGLYGLQGLGITAVYPTHAWAGGDLGLVAPEMLRPLGGFSVPASFDTSLRTGVGVFSAAIGAAIGSAVATEKWGKAGGSLAGIAAGIGIGWLGVVIYNQFVTVSP